MSGGKKVNTKNSRVKISRIENAVEEVSFFDSEFLYCLFSLHKAKKTATKNSAIFRKSMDVPITPSRV